MPNFPNFPIPSETPEETRCIQLHIPDNEQWIQVFAGLLAIPSYWFNWQRDEARSGKELAQHWTKIYDAIDWSNMSCCPEILGTRYNEETGEIEITYDGVIWVPAKNSGDDPRYTSPQLPPIPTTGNALDDACRSATNVTNAIKGVVDGIIADKDELLTILTLATAIAALIAAIFVFPPAASALIGLVIVAARTIFALTAAEMAALFTTDVYNDLQCIIYCELGDSDTFTESIVANIVSKIGTTFSGEVESLLSSIVKTMAEPGMNAAARGGSIELGDCTDCDCGYPEVWKATLSGNELLLPDEGTNNVYTISAIYAGYSDVYSLYLFFQDIGASPTPPWNGGIYSSIEVLSGATYNRGTYSKETGTVVSSSWPADDACVGGIYGEANAVFTVRITVNACP